MASKSAIRSLKAACSADNPLAYDVHLATRQMALTLKMYATKWHTLPARSVETRGSGCMLWQQEADAARAKSGRERARRPG